MLFRLTGAKMAPHVWGRAPTIKKQRGLMLPWECQASLVFKSEENTDSYYKLYLIYMAVAQPRKCFINGRK